jgi:eukaryotic-like serine/threonine-protein kinase
VVPAVVEKGWVHGAPAKWRQAVLRPGFDPLRSLALGVLEALGVDEVGALDRVVDGFRRSDRALANLVAERLPVGEALLVLVDQLEEAFTLAKEEALARFDAVLAEAVRDPGRRMYLVTTIRSDFVGRFDALPGLGALLNAGADAGRYLLEPMSGVALREAIERPAGRAGLVWEAGLVDRILEDASTAEGGLPLVAHVLRELWGARAGRALGHAAYDALGGVSGALTKSADGIVDGLGEGGREWARRMLLKLVDIERGSEDRRRTASRKDVVEAGGKQGEQVLLGLSGGRRAEGDAAKLRLVVVASDDKGEERVDLVHEALIRQWKTLHRWIDERRKGLEARKDLEAAASTWRVTGRHENELPGWDRLSTSRRLRRRTRRP